VEITLCCFSASATIGQRCQTSYRRLSAASRGSWRVFKEPFLAYPRSPPRFVKRRVKVFNSLTAYQRNEAVQRRPWTIGVWRGRPDYPARKFDPHASCSLIVTVSSSNPYRFLTTKTFTLDLHWNVRPRSRQPGPGRPRWLRQSWKRWQRQRKRGRSRNPRRTRWRTRRRGCGGGFFVRLSFPYR